MSAEVEFMPDDSARFEVALGNLTYGNRFHLVYAVRAIPHDERIKYRYFAWGEMVYRDGEPYVLIHASPKQPYERLLGRYC